MVAITSPNALDVNNASPAIKSFAITPADNTPFQVTIGGIVYGFCRAIYVGGTGDVTIINMDGTTVKYTACPVGLIIPAIAQGVMSTGTSATSLVGMI